MKITFFNSCALVCFSAWTMCTAQVQIDKPIQMNGSSASDRAITNLSTPVNPTDAANKAYVDAAGGGGMSHYVGELYGGGVVAAVWKESGVEHGLVVSLADQSTSGDCPCDVWSNVNTLIGITAQSYTDGAGNTAAIVGQAGNASGAARMCSDLVTGGFSDWYLPAFYELGMIYQNVNTINFALSGDGNPASVPLKMEEYWTSTESPNVDEPTRKAWKLNFSSGGGGYEWYKNYVYARTRAVRRY